MKSRAIKGRFKPANPAKYKGDIKKITYRSLWERRFMLYCDRSDQIVSWSSEELHVPYFFIEDEKWHNYYPDFLIETHDGRTIMVEIKPESQWRWPQNLAKWSYAAEYCDQNGYDFKVLGKKELYGR